jgi:aryl-alcohol dehydrogenase-like predicted oxidoreductase
VECIASRALTKRDWLSSTRYTRKARYSGIQVGFILPLFGEGLIDLADEYGDSEDLLGKWFAANPEKRKDIFLATKFGMRSKPAELKKGLVIDSSPEYCRKALERSLGRLGLPYVDLYYVHRLDKITPIEKTIEALVELKNAGKIKHLGLSECSAETLRRAYAVHPITCVEVEYSVFYLAIEEPQVRLLETARELGVAVVAYSPMGNGVLTGSLRTLEDFTKQGDLRAALPWLKEDNLEKNVAVVDKLSEIAKAKGVTTAQLALAWLLAQGDDIFPIPGTKGIHHLTDNLESMSISLSADEEKAVRKLSPEAIGGRLQAMTGYAFADTPPL